MRGFHKLVGNADIVLSLTEAELVLTVGTVGCWRSSLTLGAALCAVGGCEGRGVVWNIL